MLCAALMVDAIIDALNNLENFILNRLSRLASLALVALLLAAPGAIAQGIEVESLDGKRSKLGAFIARDKWTLIMVWTTYCGICREQYPIISEFHTKHSASDATVVGISLDGYGQGEKVSAYQQARAHSFPSVLAEADDFSVNYEKTIGKPFTGTPTYLLFDRKGSLHAFMDGTVTLKALERSIAQ